MSKPRGDCWQRTRKKRDPHIKPETKQARYRVRLRAEGRCVRCGKPSAPHELCRYHRLYKRWHHVLGTNNDRTACLIADHIIPIYEKRGYFDNWLEEFQPTRGVKKDCYIDYLKPTEEDKP